MAEETKTDKLPDIKGKDVTVCKPGLTLDEVKQLIMIFESGNFSGKTLSPAYALRLKLEKILQGLSLETPIRGK